MVIVVVGIGAVVLCIKIRRKLRERDHLENPTYIVSPVRMKKEEIFHPEAVENDYVFMNALSAKGH